MAANPYFSKSGISDSYTITNLLWKFGLSWWEREYLTNGKTIASDRAEVLLSFLLHHEQEVKKELKGDPQAEYFSSKYRRLISFLKREGVIKNETDDKRA